MTAVTHEPYGMDVVIAGKNIVLGVSGGIAAFKAVLLCRELIRRRANVRVVMTESATRFVGPLTFGAITGSPPAVDLFDARYPGEVHVELGRWADAMVIAPGTMNVLARLAHGLADDVVLTTAACVRGPVIVAPAMHHRMWNQSATQENLIVLKARGVEVVGPVVGELASGEVGDGRMEEPERIADAVEALFGRKDLAGVRVVISAGPTFEDLDPVRFLGNRSSGKMGYRIAERAQQRGAQVTLVSGPVALPPPALVETVRVRSAVEMDEAVRSRLAAADVIVMAAAVADYRPAHRAEHKIKKTDAPLTVELVRNPDILAGLGKARTGARPILVGFAVETESLIERAREKLTSKRLDLVVANHASVGFEGDDNEAALVSPDEAIELPRMSKTALADHILDQIALRMGRRAPSPSRGA